MKKRREETDIRKEELVEAINACKKYKQELQDNLKTIAQNHPDSDERKKKEEEYLNGKTEKAWLFKYDRHIKEYRKELISIRNKQIVKSPITISILVLIILATLFYVSTQVLDYTSITGQVVSEIGGSENSPQTSEEPPIDTTTPAIEPKSEETLQPRIEKTQNPILNWISSAFKGNKNTRRLMELKGSDNKILDSEITIIDSQGKRTSIKKSSEITFGEYDLEIVLDNKPVKKIMFMNLNYSGNLDLGFDELPNYEHDQLKILKGKKVFVINPEQLEFEEAIVTGTATGDSLFKCKDWDFTTQTCNGDWLKIQDLVPGQDYSFILTADDPGFAEGNLTVINVQSYPTVGGNWTVRFVTNGTANLRISAINGTTWSETNNFEDLRFFEIRCGEQIQTYQWINNSVFIENYYCNETSYETSGVITPGKHHLMFEFGEDVAYANNFASNAIGFMWLDAPQDVTPTTGSWQSINLTSYAPAGITGAIMAMMSESTSTDYSVGVRGIGDSAPGCTGTFCELEDQTWRFQIVRVENMIIQGYTENALTHIMLMGYSQGTDPVFFDPIVQLTSPGNGWQTINVSQYVASDSDGVCVLVEIRENSDDDVQLRAVGSSNDQTAREWEEYHTETWCVELDQYKQFQIDLEDAGNINFYLIAETKGFSLTYFPNYVQLPNPTFNTWADTDLDTYATIPSYTSGAFFRATNEEGFTDVDLMLRNDSQTWNGQVGTVNREIGGDKQIMLGTPVDMSTNIFERYHQDDGDTSESVLYLEYVTRFAFNDDYPQFSNIQVNTTGLRLNQYARFNLSVTDTSHNISFVNGTIDGTTYNLTQGSGAEWYYDWQCTAPDGNSYINFTWVGANDTGFPVAWNETNISGVYIVCDLIPPSVQNPTFNVTVINQSHQVKFNSTITDALSNITSVTATLKYPNGTNVPYNLSNTGSEYYVLINDTIQPGVYNLTQIFVEDQVGNTNTSNYDNIIFNVTISPPSAFNLISPGNDTVTTNLTPILSWQQSADETFQNYTILIDNNIDFSSPSYVYLTDTVTNTSIDVSIATNVLWYWKVIAFDTFDSSRESTNFYLYITDTTNPVVNLNNPSDLGYVTTSSFNFNYTPTDTNLYNCSLYIDASFNQSNSSPTSGVPNYFPITLPDGSYLWNVECYDRADNNFTASDYTVNVDTTPPTIWLEYPPNDYTENVTNNVVFYYNVSDFMTDIDSCVLILNGVVDGVPDISVQEGQTQNFTAFVDNDNHTWSINCTDDNGWTNSSLTYNLEVAVTFETDPPVIIPYFPEPNDYLDYNSVQFNYTPNDASGIENCSIFIDGALNDTNYSVSNGFSNYFLVSNFAQQTFEWYVGCYDNSSYAYGVSSLSNFTVDLINPTVNLNNPGDNTFNTIPSVLFNYTPSDTNLDNCSLYADFSGPFVQHQINTSPSSSQPNGFTETLSDGTYLWNVLCYDKSNRSSFAPANYTVFVDANYPWFDNASADPASPYNYSPSQVYQFNITVIDEFLDSVWLEHNFSGTLQNYSVNASSNNIYFYNYTPISVGSYVYRWFANDSLARINYSYQYPYIVNKIPSEVNLLLNGTDDNLTIDEDLSINLSANMVTPFSGVIELYLSGVMINNGSSPISNITLFSQPGLYNITAVYPETQNYASSYETHFLTVNDITFPTITPVYPEDNATIGTYSLTFRYNISDNVAIYNCSLFIDEAFEYVDTAVENNQENNFPHTFSADGNYTWFVECFDTSFNKINFTPYNLTIIDSTTIYLNVTTDKYTYEHGEIAKITTNISDKFDNPLDANITTDIIIGNTTLPWWNTSWPYRKQIYLSNSLDLPLTRWPVIVNITGLGGNINDCINETRIINNNNLNQQEIPSQVINGDNSTWCEIVFLADITNNTINESNYLIYYGFDDGTPSYTDPITSAFSAGTSWNVDNGNITMNFVLDDSYGRGDGPAISYITTPDDTTVLDALTGYSMEDPQNAENQPANITIVVDGPIYKDFYMNTNTGGACWRQTHYRFYAYQPWFEVLHEAVAGTAACGDYHYLGVNGATDVWTDSIETPGPAANTMFDFDDWACVEDNGGDANDLLCVAAGFAPSQPFGANAGYNASMNWHTTVDGLYWNDANDPLGSLTANYSYWYFSAENNNPSTSSYVNDTATKIRSIVISSVDVDFEEWVDRKQNLTVALGTWSWFWDTFASVYGNYSAVSLAQYSGFVDNADSAQFEIIPDTTPPSINLTYPPNGSSFGIDINFTYIPYDITGLLNCSLYINGTFNASNSSIANNLQNNFSDYSFDEGFYSWFINCTDRNNLTNVSYTYYFTKIDVGPPNATINYPYNGSYINDATPEINFTLTDNSALTLNYTIFIDGSPNGQNGTVNNGTPTLLNLSTLSNGPHEIIVEATDLQGNKGNSTAIIITIDTLDPTVSLNWPGNLDYVLTSSFNFNYTPSDTNLDNCSLYGDFNGTWAFNQTDTVTDNNQPNYFPITLLDDTYIWNVECIDLASNTGFAIANYTVLVDTTPPTIWLEYPPNNYTENVTNNVVFYYNVSDFMTDIASCVLILDDDVDGVPDISVQEGQTQNFTALVLNGNHNWSINCTDDNGWTNSSLTYNLSVSILGETDPPVINLYFPEPNDYLDYNSVQFNYTPNDASGIENCSIYVDSVLNDTNYTIINNAPNYFNIPGFAEQTFEWYVECVDNSTNASGTSSVSNFTVDLTNPSVVLNTPGDNDFFNESNVLFNYTPSDTNLDNCSLYADFSGPFVQHQINTSPSSSQPNGFTETLSDGTYLWNVLCYDKSNRSSFAPANYTVFVDANYPWFDNASADPASPYNYSPSQVYQFNITVIDEFLDSVWLEHNFSGTLQNYSVNASIGDVYFYNYTGLSVGIYSYRWFANDSLARINYSQQYFYNVTKASSEVNLLLNGTDGNLTIDEDLSINLSANMVNPASGVIELYVSGVMINNGSSPISNITLFSQPGLYNITVVYPETQDYASSYETHYLTVNDKTSPNVTGIFPSENNTIGSLDITFRYNISDVVGIYNCSLYVNNTFISVDTAVENNQENTAQYTVGGDGNYTWFVQCFDTSFNEANSTIINFEVIETTEIVVNVTTDQFIYERGETADIITMAEDIFGNPLDADITTDIVLGNTSLPWWNISWDRRIPILLNETSGFNRTDAIVRVNITGLSGYINSCIDELRVINNNSLSFYEVPFNVLNGDNSTFCDITFRANISANAVNENNYFVYYNNSAAIDVGYGTLSVDKNITFDTFEVDFGNWTDQGGTCLYVRNQDNTPSATTGFGNTGGDGFDHTIGDSTGWYIYVEASANVCQGADTEATIISNSFSAGTLGTILSFWFQMHGASMGTLHVDVNNGSWVNDTWTQVGQYQTAPLQPWAFAEVNLSAYSGSLQVRFRYDSVSGWEADQLLDDINITVYDLSSGDLDSGIKEVEELVDSKQNTSVSSGTWTWLWNTFNYSYGNYSAVSLAQYTDFNDGSDYAWFEIISDTTPPNISLIYPENNSYKKDENITFIYVPDDNAWVINCSLYLDSSFNQSNSSIQNELENNFTVNNILEGVHDWYINCTDVNNNTNISETYNFTLDLTAPNASITSPQNNTYTNDNTPEINFTLTDNIANLINYTVFVNGVPNGQIGNNTNNTPTLLNLSVLADGVREIVIEATDFVGNKYNSTPLTLNIDTTEPAIILYAPPQGYSTNNENITFNFTFADAVSPNATCDLTINGILRDTLFVNNSVPANTTIINFELGTYYWNATCTETAGNTNISETWNFTVDTEAPIITLGNPENNSYINNDPVVFYFNVSDNMGIENCSLILNDTINYTKSSGLQNNDENNITVSLDDSAYEWSINCTDTESNMGSSQEKKNLVIDTVPPTTFDLVSPNGTISNILTPTMVWQQTTENNFANYTLQVDDNSGFISVDYTYYTYEFDNISVQTSLGPDTTWYWRVIAYDLAANSRISNQVFNYTTDNSAPSVTLIAPPDNDNDPDGNVTFFYTVSDLTLNNCSLYTNISGVFEENQTDPFVVNGLNSFILNNLAQNTTFIWNVNCSDYIGNSGFYEENWTIKITGPDDLYQNVTIPTNLTLNNSPPIIFNMNLQDPINLFAGTNTSVNCTFQIEDGNGVADIQTVNATLFHETSNSSAVDDFNIHYTNSSCSCVNSDSITKNCTCEFDLRYYAQNGSWTCNASVADENITVYESDTATLNDLRALYITPFLIDYGDLAAMQISSTDVNVTITNYGNIPIDVSLFGYGVGINDGLGLDCFNGNITVGYERFDLAFGTAYGSMTQLSGNSAAPNAVDATIPKKTNESVDASDEVYWKIEIPITAQGTCNGTIVFTAEYDT